MALFLTFDGPLIRSLKLKGALREEVQQFTRIVQITTSQMGAKYMEEK